jgi:hypothetical protein
MKRAINILILALCGAYSPSLDRRVRISDIWLTPQYAGALIRRDHV